MSQKSRKDKQREFFDKFSKTLLNELYRQSDILSGIAGKTKERLFYGMISRSLSRTLARGDVIMTEFPLKRGNNDGRADFIFTYDNLVYVMEFKVGYAGVQSNTENNNTIVWPWLNKKNTGVIDQIKGIKGSPGIVKNIKELFDCGEISERGLPDGVCWFPMVILGLQTTSKKSNDQAREIQRKKRFDERIKNANENFAKIHDEIFNNIYRKNHCKFARFKNNFRYINPTRNKKGDRAVIGYILFAGHTGLPGNKFGK